MFVCQFFKRVYGFIHVATTLFIHFNHVVFFFLSGFTDGSLHRSFIVDRGPIELFLVPASAPRLV